MLLDSQLGELNLMAVSALELLPLDDAELPLGSFELDAPMMPCFAAFLPKSARKSALPSSLQTSLVFSLLQARALKALQRLLKHPASMRVALAGGLLPGIMASAATPIPLLGIHHTDVLQMQLTLLEQIRIEGATAARMAKEHVQLARERRTTMRLAARSSAAAASGSGGSAAAAAAAASLLPGGGGTGARRSQRRARAR